MAEESAKSAFIEKLIFTLLPLLVAGVGYLLSAVSTLSHDVTVLTAKTSLVVTTDNKQATNSSSELAREKLKEELVKEIAPVFNRAVIFDTTQNSWHGLSRPLIQPNGVYRKSLAVYYLEDTVKDFDSRSRALFSLTEKQQSTTNSTEPCPHLLVRYN